MCINYFRIDLYYGSNHCCRSNLCRKPSISPAFPLSLEGGMGMHHDWKEGRLLGDRGTTLNASNMHDRMKPPSKLISSLSRTYHADSIRVTKNGMDIRGCEVCVYIYVMVMQMKEMRKAYMYVYVGAWRSLNYCYHGPQPCKYGGQV